MERARLFELSVLDRMLLTLGRAPPRASAGALVLCAHSLLDGVAIGFAFQGSRAVGLIVAAAVLTHDFLDGVNTMNIVLRNGGERARGLRWLLADAAAPAAGIAATRLWAMPSDRFGLALALFGGFFLYIGASDLIPESFHAHPKLLTTVMTLPAQRSSTSPFASSDSLGHAVGGAARRSDRAPRGREHDARDGRPLHERQALVQKAPAGERAERRLAAHEHAEGARWQARERDISSEYGSALESSATAHAIGSRPDRGARHRPAPVRRG